MMEGGERLLAYPFHGYWKDVGTIESLWEANMDLINPKVELDLSDPNWKIYARSQVMPAHYVSPESHVQNSLVAGGCNIYGEVDFSVLFTGAFVGTGAIVRDSIIMPGALGRRGRRGTVCNCCRGCSHRGGRGGRRTAGGYCRGRQSRLGNRRGRRRIPGKTRGSGAAQGNAGRGGGGKE